MSGRIIMILPEDLSDTGLDMIRRMGDFPLIKISNTTLDTSLSEGETAYQLHDDTGEFTGIGTGELFRKFSKDIPHLGPEIRELSCVLFEKYLADVKKWAELIKDISDRLDLPFIGIAWFFADRKANDMRFEPFCRQEHDLTGLDHKLLLELGNDTILMIRNNRRNQIKNNTGV